MSFHTISSCSCVFEESPSLKNVSMVLLFASDPPIANLQSKLMKITA